MKKITCILILMFTSICSHAVTINGNIAVQKPNFFFGSNSALAGDIDLINNTLTFGPFDIFGVASNATMVELLTPGTYTRTHNLSSGGSITRTDTIPTGSLGAYLIIESNSAEHQIYVAWTVSPDNTIFTNVPIPGNALISNIYSLNGALVSINFSTPPAGVISVAINLAGNETQECNQTGGTNVSMDASVILGINTVLDRIDWYLDEVFIAQGSTITQLIPLGTHTITATAVSVSGLSQTDSTTINIIDTARPNIEIIFLDSFGNQVTTASNGNIQIDLSAIDTCDPQPTISNGSASPVMNVFDGDIISIDGSLNEVHLPTTGVQVTARVTDSSGNVTTGLSVLNIQ